MLRGIVFYFLCKIGGKEIFLLVLYYQATRWVSHDKRKRNATARCGLIILFCFLPPDSIDSLSKGKIKKACDVVSFPILWHEQYEVCQPDKHWRFFPLAKGSQLYHHPLTFVYIMHDGRHSRRICIRLLTIWIFLSGIFKINWLKSRFVSFDFLPFLQLMRNSFSFFKVVYYKSSLQYDFIFIHFSLSVSSGVQNAVCVFLVKFPHSSWYCDVAIRPWLDDAYTQ